MEVTNGNKHRDLICIYEALGTGFLLISVNWGALGGNQAAGVAFGIFIYILFLSPVCGSNFNPAVTLGVLIKDGGNFQVNIVTCVLTIFAQIVGGFFGVLLVWSTINFSVPINQNIAILQPGPGHNFLRVFIAEMFGTFLFVSFVLSVKYHQKNMSNTFGCFLVGMALFGVLNMVGGLSGGCINPAVGLVQCVFQYLIEIQYSGLHEVEISPYITIYIFATATGGILAGIFQRISDISQKALKEEKQIVLNEMTEMPSSRTDASQDNYSSQQPLQKLEKSAYIHQSQISRQNNNNSKQSSKSGNKTVQVVKRQVNEESDEIEIPH